MFIQINPSSGVPIYRQIVDQVKVAIATTTLQRGQQLPSVRALSETLVINPTTVQRAYLDLEREGVIETRRGQGTYVRVEAVPLADRERKRRVTHLLKHALAEAHRVRLGVNDVRKLFEAELERFFAPATKE